jgi:23S rRNA pseudouridine1911/1915/1917 synthase
MSQRNRQRRKEAPGVATTPDVYHVEPGDAGSTLAAVIRSWQASISWSQAQRLVETRRVLVDGNLCLDSARRLRGGEVLKILAESASPIPTDRDVKIHFLDGHIVIVEKPSGMTSARYIGERNWSQKRKQFQPTLDEYLPRILSRIGRTRTQRGHRGPPSVRPVHRLDRETSGLMAFARTPQAQLHLNKQFRLHTIERRYWAIVHGRIASPRTFESNLVRDRGDGRRGTTDDPEAGQRAVTHLIPVEQYPECSLVECVLETGRTHQIRIHLSEAGHPVCGEKVYASPAKNRPPRVSCRPPRLALHAFKLGLIHPATEKPMNFEIGLPRDLEEFVRRLRAGGQR